MKKIGIVSLGCSKNLVDSENILGLFDHHKYLIVSEPSEADIIVVNTCGFIDASKKESLDTIFEMLNFGKKVVVTGCLVERYLDDLKKEIPEVSLFIPIRDYPRFNELLATLDEDIDNLGGLDDQYRVVSTGGYTAYLKIGEGCSNRCTYCAIPLIRGGYVSRPFDEIIAEARKLADQGYKEVIILEQDTTRYGTDLKDKKTICDLLRELLKIKELDFIRLLYLYPDEITEELIDLIKDNSDRLTPYFDIPIQHSEDHILKDMYRRGNKEYLRKLFTAIRTKVPNSVIRTTVMVGFPGETNEDVDNLLSFMEEISFDHLGAFTYSREEGTESYNFENQIDEKTKKDRLSRVMKAQQIISYKNNKKRVGQIMMGLVVGKDKDQYLLRSYFNAPDDIDGKIYFTSTKDHVKGDKVTVKITDAFVYDLFGQEIDS